MAYECGVTFKLKDEVSKSLGSIKGNIGDVKSTLGSLNSVSGNTNSKLSILKRGFLGVKSSSDSGGNGIKGFNNSCNNTSPINNLTSKLKTLAAQYVGVKSAIGFAKKSIQGGMEFENMRNTLNVVMKDSKLAGEKFREAVEFANATPFDTKEIVGGFVKLESYGVKTTKEVTTAVGDMAGVMNKSFDQAVEALADAQTGELERLKEFGITKEQIVAQGAKKLGDIELVNNKGQITNQEAFNDALLSLMQERFKGGMELQSKTLSGSISTMKGVIGNTMAQLSGVTEDGMVKSGGAVDLLKNKVLQVTQTVQKWATDGGLKKVTDNMQKGFKKAGEAIQFCKKHANIIIPVLKSVAIGFASLKTINTVTKGIHSAVDAFKSVKNAISGVKTALGMLSPTKIILMGIVLAGILLYKNWDTIKEKAHELHAKVSEKWEAIKNKCEPVTSAIKEGWNSVKEGWNSFKDGVSHGVNLAVKRWDEMKAKCKEVVDDISEKWETLKTILAHPIQATVSFIKNGDLSGVETEKGKPHKTGLNRVPFDGYRAELHEGERVLTKQETDLLDQGKLGANNGGSSPTINLNISNMTVREEADINKIANTLARMIRNDGLNYA